MKKVVCILLSVALCLSLTACSFLRDVADSTLNIVARSKTFEMDGISIELTTDFLQMDFLEEEFDFAIGSEELAVMGLKVPNEDESLKDITALEFAQNFHSLIEDEEVTEVTEIEGIPTFQYEALSDGETQRLAVMFYKGTDCFWLLFFGTEADEFSDVYEDICKYAKTVECK